MRHRSWILRLTWLAPLVLAGCFPTLPDPLWLQDLRVLGVQSNPATVAAAFEPPPVVTVHALVVDPDDPELEATSHSWGLQLDGDNPALSPLAALLPSETPSPTLSFDFQLLPAGLRSELVGALPLRYVADNGEVSREAVKVVPFLPAEVPFGNQNPRILTVTEVDGPSWSAADGSLPGIAAPLYIGSREPGEDFHFTIELDDDTGDVPLEVSMFWTSGRAGLAGAEPEDTDADGTASFGSGDLPVLDDEIKPREFGWTATDRFPERVARIFLIVRDELGAQTWQEMRAEEAPNP
jgi:hypothetical protein